MSLTVRQLLIDVLYPIVTCTDNRAIDYDFRSVCHSLIHGIDISWCHVQRCKAILGCGVYKQCRYNIFSMSYFIALSTM